MTYSFHSTGQITFNNGTARLTTTPTKDEKWQRLAWEQEQQRRSQKEIDEEREELRGIYKFHKLPVPETIVPEIIPEVNFGTKNFYPWLDRKGGRIYSWRGSCTTLGIRNHGYKIHWVNYYAVCDVTKKCKLHGNRCEACKAGNTLKGRLFADHLKDGIFQNRFSWTIHIKKKKVVIHEPEIVELEKIKIPESKEHRFYVRPIIKGVNSF